MIKPGYGDTAAALDGPGHDKLQGLIGTAWSYLLSMAGANRREKNLDPIDPLHPDRWSTRPARR